MKILHVLRSPVGGLFRHVVDLAQGQIERGHEVGMVVDSGTAQRLSEEKLTELAPKLALGLSRFRIYRQPGPADLGAIWHVGRCIRAAGAEIVHGHGAKGGALARLDRRDKRWCGPIRRMAAACTMRWAAASAFFWNAC